MTTNTMLPTLVTNVDTGTPEHLVVWTYPEFANDPARSCIYHPESGTYIVNTCNTEACWTRKDMEIQHADMVNRAAEILADHLKASAA